MYFIVHDFMISEMHLQGAELLVFAILYGYSHGEQRVYRGGVSALAERLGLSRQGTIKALARLEQKGMIERSDMTIRGMRVAEFRTAAEWDFGGVNPVDRGVNSVYRGVNSVDIYNKDILNNNISKKEIKKEKESIRADRKAYNTTFSPAAPTSYVEANLALLAALTPKGNG